MGPTHDPEILSKHATISVLEAASVLQGLLSFKMHPSNLEEQFLQITNNEKNWDKARFLEIFEDVINKMLDMKMGIGYLSYEEAKLHTKVVLQGTNPFLDILTVNTLVTDTIATDYNISTGMEEYFLGKSWTI